LGTIRVRILAVVVVMLVVSSIGSVLLLRAVLFERLDDEVDESLTREAEEFGLLIAGNNPETGEPFDGDLRAVFDVYFAREVPDEGETLLAFIDGEVYRAERAQDAAEAEELQPAIEYWLALDEREQGEIDTALGNAKYIAMPLTGQGQDGLYVVVNFPGFERREIAAAVRTQIVVQLVTMVLVSALGLLLAGRVLRPLASLARTAPTISDTDLTQRIPVTGRDEASKIAGAFNEMLARLEGAFDTQKRFLHDTSHELRTPLTVIRGHVELLELDTTEADRQATIDLVTDEIDRMSRIVNDLFLLAMSERPDFLQVEPVDLREIVVDAHQKVTALGVRDWQVEAPTPVPVVGDAQRLTQAITQLAANAVKFTDEDDTIRIGAAVRDGTAMVWVEDSGPGVSAEDAEQIFERFGRAGQERDPNGGAGLGLAIVQAIAEAHGGSVRLRSRPGEGARFEILIPTDVSSAAGR
jgi:signal transduction histidine kinase